MKQPFALSLALLLLFPCCLSAQDVTEPAAQAPDASPTPTEVPSPTEVPQAVDSSSVTNKYAITSYEPATASYSRKLKRGGKHKLGRIDVPKRPAVCLPAVYRGCLIHFTRLFCITVHFILSYNTLVLYFSFLNVFKNCSFSNQKGIPSTMPTDTS